jgi:hypothetical protein
MDRSTYLALLSGDGGGDFGAEDSVVHHENLEFGDVVDDKSLEVLLVLASVSVGGLGSEADRGHDVLALESSSHSRIDTSWLSPGGIDAHEAEPRISLRNLGLIKIKSLLGSSCQEEK